ncbi:MAG: hypothetical protein H6891_02320 [Brucellaceae bacterium]|nr:hypothetical protein [Brucellaceae bacterium]
MRMSLAAGSTLQAITRARSNTISRHMSGSVTASPSARRRVHGSAIFRSKADEGKNGNRRGQDGNGDRKTERMAMAGAAQSEAR